MADPISVATGIVGLFSVGWQCFTFFSDVKNADKKARLKQLEIEIQGHRFRDWGYYWDMGSDEAAPSQKLVKFFGENPHKAAGVSKALTAIADLLSDKKLLRRYGVTLTPRNGKVNITAFFCRMVLITITVGRRQPSNPTITIPIGPHKTCRTQGEIGLSAKLSLGSR
jgi:hypothetical protein